MKDVGFTPDEPMSDIRRELLANQTYPIYTILSSPAYACDFITNMRNWQNKAKKETENISNRLSYSLGVNHPKAGQELRNYLNREIQSRREQKKVSQSESHSINKELGKIRAKYGIAKTSYDNMIIPNYCIVAEIIDLLSVF